jgi:ComF family protein
MRRGFNQSELLAGEISRLLDIPLAEWAVSRVRATATQTRLSPEQRRSNVAGAFECKDFAVVDDSTILVIDDVMTTGATLGAIARSLSEAGAHRVFAWTFSRA